MKKRNPDREVLMRAIFYSEYDGWFQSVCSAIDQLPAEQRAAFDEWDRNRPPNVGTSEWPGIADLIKPAPTARDVRRWGLAPNR
jgi:hypothetical protein